MGLVTTSSFNALLSLYFSILPAHSNAAAGPLHTRPCSSPFPLLPNPLRTQDAPYATAESRPESQQLRSSLRGCGHPMCISPACQAAVLRILQDKPHCSRRRSLQTPSGCRSTSCPQVAEPINTILAGLAALAGETSGSIAQHGARNTRRSYEWPRSGGPVSQPALGVAASRSHLSCAQWNTPGLASPPASSSNLTSRCSMQSPMAVTALVAVSNIVDNCRAARGGGRVQIRRSGGGRVSLERVHTPRAAQMPNHAAL